MYRNIEDIEKEMDKRIAETAAFLEAWRNVKFPTKKDGTPFKNMNKNFDGAKYVPISYAMQANENELEIHACTRETGYIKDTISCYEIVKYMNNSDKPTRKPENLAPKCTMLNQIYIYDMEDIKEAIANRIEYLAKRLEDLKKQKENVKTAFTNYKKAIGEARKQLAEDSFKNENNDLYYLILDTTF